MKNRTYFKSRVPFFNTLAFFFSLLILLLQGFAFETEGCNSDEAVEKAEKSLETLIDHFWNDDLKMFNNQYLCNECNDTFHYWWQAHAIDVLLDGYELTGKKLYIQYAKKMNQGLLDRNGGHLYNDFTTICYGWDWLCFGLMN